MKVLTNKDIIEGSSVVTIGSYDGVHYGHRKILEMLFDKAEVYGAKPVLMTLFPHPRKVLNLDLPKLHLMNSLEEKKYLLNKCGLPILYIATFDSEFSQLSGEQYVKEYIVDRLNAKAVIIGYDHHFGKDRGNGYDFLCEMGSKYGFDVYEIPKQDIDSANISSTVIRKLLEKGEIVKANKYLCEPYFFMGEIDDLGYLKITEELKLIPPAGIYSAMIKCRGENLSIRVLIVVENGKNRVKIDSYKCFKGICVLKIIEKI